MFLCALKLVLGISTRQICHMLVEVQFNPFAMARDTSLWGCALSSGSCGPIFFTFAVQTGPDAAKFRPQRWLDMEVHVMRFRERHGRVMSSDSVVLWGRGTSIIL